MGTKVSTWVPENISTWYLYNIDYYAMQMGLGEFLDSGCKCWTLDSELCTLDSERWNLDAGLWMLNTGHWTMDTGLWMLDIVIVCFRGESEPSFWFCLIKWLKTIWVRISIRISWSRLFCREYRFWRHYCYKRSNYITTSYLEDCSWPNLTAWGEYLTSQVSWVTAWVLVTRVCPVHLVDELVLMFYASLWLG